MRALTLPHLYIVCQLLKIAEKLQREFFEQLCAFGFVPVFIVAESDCPEAFIRQGFADLPVYNDSR